jgi:hypothetical protein
MINVTFLTNNQEPQTLAVVALAESPLIGDQIAVGEELRRVVSRRWKVGGGASEHRLWVFTEPVPEKEVKS